MYSLTVVNDDAEKYTLTHSGKKAYFENDDHAFSFDCTSMQFDELVTQSMVVNGFVLYTDSFMLVKSNSTYEVDEEGSTILRGSKKLIDENEKNTLLGSLYPHFTGLSDIELEVSVKFKSVKYIDEINIYASFSNDDGNGTVFYEVDQRIAFSEINNKSIDIPIPKEKCYYLGNYDVVKAFSAAAVLNELQGYSATIKEENITFGEEIDFRDCYSSDFVVSNIGKQSYADKCSYIFEAEERIFNYRYYLEDGIEYFNFNNENQYVDLENDFPYYDTVALWMTPWIGIDIGYGFVYADNGDGTASFSYKLTKDEIVDIMDKYLYDFYGEDSLGAFDTVDAINKADVNIVFDLETGALIEQNIEIDVSVYYNFKTISFKKTRTVRVDIKEFNVPARDIFFGTAEL